MDVTRMAYCANGRIKTSWLSGFPFFLWFPCRCCWIKEHFIIKSLLSLGEI